MEVKPSASTRHAKRSRYKTKGRNKDSLPRPKKVAWVHPCTVPRRGAYHPPRVRRLCPIPSHIYTCMRGLRIRVPWIPHSRATHSIPPSRHAGIIHVGLSPARCISNVRRHLGGQLYTNLLDIAEKTPYDLAPHGEKGAME